MPGGPRAAYERVQPILESIAARANGEPCVAYLGPGSAGHYVKMVHNGIEYGLMQLLAETYGVLKNAAGLANQELHALFDEWNQSTELNSFLVEITAQIFRKKDPNTGKQLIDVIKDVARQKGTGKWTSQEAMDLQVPVPTIDMAVCMRDLSGHEEDRRLASQVAPAIERKPAEPIDGIKDAYFAAMLLTYVQGMSLLARASDAHGYNLNLAVVTRIWRGGCIIRAAILDVLVKTFESEPNLSNLLTAPQIAERLTQSESALRHVVATAIQHKIPVPGLMTALAYFDALRAETLTTNLIQAQRDYFGAHGYERTDEEGKFHTNWE